MTVFKRVFVWISALCDLELPPKSVGASVDKMFAVGYRPYG